MKNVLIVSATTRTKVEFNRISELGRSLERVLLDPGISSNIAYENTGQRLEGRSNIYNRFLTPAFSDLILLFVHDDVYIDDFLIRQRLNEGLANFDVVGLAGNKAPDFRQPSWGLKWKEDGTWDGWQDAKNLSGVVAHKAEDKINIAFYGETPAACELLDGLFLAVNTERILEAGAKFDPQFKFHFYDLDFSRICRQKNLSLGTWPIAVTHASGGSYGSQEWQIAKSFYERKWQTK
jgi:hypothetical protein